MKRKYPCDGRKTIPKSNVQSKSFVSSGRNDLRSDKLERTSISQDIPTFDGAEFSGDKPLSRETLFKIMEMLGIPEEKRERFAEGEENLRSEKNSGSHETEKQEMFEIFQQLHADLTNNKQRENVPEINGKKDHDNHESKDVNDKQRPTRVKAPHMDAEEKKLINRFNRLFQEMKQNGRDNGEELCILLDELKDCGTFNGEDCQKVYDVIGDICN